MVQSISYADAGVSIDNANRAVAKIREYARATFNERTLTEIGSFGGMFSGAFPGMAEPILVASADGVGTKLKLAFETGIHNTVGADLVNHCVNDILVQGAVPLFFLDYLALGRIDVEKVEAIVRGVARACSEFGCPLVGGETAQMPDVYAPEDYDLAGFIVGVVDKDKALTGARVREGDVLIGLPSAGLHTNGYTLARKVLFEAMGHRVDTAIPELGTTVGAALLAPHRSYLSALEPLLERDRVRALAHITGGGFAGNIPRVLPSGLGARVRKSAWPVPPLFRLIQKGGQVAEDEMYRTFNMGIGMVAVVSPEDHHEVEHSLERRGETAFVIGSVVKGEGVVLE